ncbi:single-stranded DNA-binding protein [Epidermidibacterium keratini]|uniref:Single-stranded DNA-binding protein n=1 Tax=Epidermidibacterium keratini TaxID=1891644 RepID=A0A7L4YH65_9ACTN|nr:single-stranded DNA-binding protein [Epidermidibacterium keratini]QHB98944.1 single-stranded DNA-binding protein [Epidermidibacterium keratini]
MSTSEHAAAPPSALGDNDDCNAIALRGRLSGEVEFREIPSGSTVAVWRLVVRRTTRDLNSSVTVDTIDCESFSKQVMRSAGRWSDGDRVEVEGALRRRFWQTPAGARSRYVVDVRAARKGAVRRET